MKIFVSAAEASSDLQASELLKGLNAEFERRRVSVDWIGMGGDRLVAQGLHPEVHAKSMSVMGFAEILSKLPVVFRNYKRLKKLIETEKPDLAILVDFPEFHFILMRFLKKRGVPVIYFIPPKVWVWRTGRVKKLRKFVDKILCILPFEKRFYERKDIAATYVGNPLTEILPLELTKIEARKRLNLGPRDISIVIMPGSRHSEIKYNLDFMLSSAELTAEKLYQKGNLRAQDTLKVFIPVSSTSDWSELDQRVYDWKIRQRAKGSRLSIELVQDDTATCLAAADAGLIKSGTSTLEAALMKCPHVVIYRASNVTAWIFKNFVRYRGPVALSNLVLELNPGELWPFREIILEDVTIENVAYEMYLVMTDERRRQEMSRAFERVRNRVVLDESPRDRATHEVIQFLEQRAIDVGA